MMGTNRESQLLCIFKTVQLKRGNSKFWTVHRNHVIRSISLHKCV